MLSANCYKMNKQMVKKFLKADSIENSGSDKKSAHLHIHIFAHHL